jgi:hypothetical protein
MVRDVVGLRFSVAPGMRGFWVIEPAVEPAPGNVFRVEKVANVLASQLDALSARGTIENG